MPSYVEMGLRAVESMKEQPSAGRQVCPIPAASSQSVNMSDNAAACGSPWCAGCYEVLPGVRIHPPRCGGNYTKSPEAGSKGNRNECDK